MTKPFIINKPAKAILMPVRHYDEVIETLPEVKSLNFKGTDIIALKHGERETRLLRDIGFDVPTPFECYYQWPRIKGEFDPFKHQIISGGFLSIHPKCFLLNGLGLGKTETILAAFDYLKQTQQARKILIVGPLSCLDPVWVSAIFESFPHLTYSVLHGTAAKRKKNLDHDVDVYIINHDGVKVLEEEINKRNDIDVIAVDEASVLCNSQTAMWKAYSRINKPSRILWLATGTPASKAPTDAWALAKLVNPDKVPKYFGTFKRQTMIQITQFKWVPAPGSFQKVYDVLQPGIRFKKSDCLDLPPVTWENRSCELSSEQLEHIKTMRSEMTMEHNGVEVTAVNAADRVGKIRQILCGAIKVDENEYVELDFKPRLRVLKECIESAESKVVIVCPYKGITRVLNKHLSKDYTCAVINGDVPKGERNQIIHDFQKQKNPKILIAHPKTVSHGLTLTEADVLIFYGPIDSSELYIQAANRLDRPGQKRNVTIINLSGHSMERMMYQGLKEKKSLQNQALNLFKSFMKGKN